MTHCPWVPGTIISKGIHHQGRQTHILLWVHPSNHLLDSGSLSWVKDLPKNTHCHILWCSGKAQVLINPRCTRRKTTLNRFPWSPKFKYTVFLKINGHQHGRFSMGSTQEEFMTKVPTALTIRQDRARGDPSRSLQQNCRHYKASAPGHGFSKSPIRRMVNWHLLRAPSRTALICGVFDTRKSAR